MKMKIVTFLSISVLFHSQLVIDANLQSDIFALKLDYIETYNVGDRRLLILFYFIFLFVKPTMISFWWIVSFLHI